MREYISGWWSGLSSRGRTIISVVIVLAVLAAFYLALVNSAAFSAFTGSLDNLIH